MRAFRRRRPTQIVNISFPRRRESPIQSLPPPAYSLPPFLPQMVVVLQRLAVVRKDEPKLAVIKGGIAPMDRHVVARAQKHHVLDAILAARADPVQMMTLAGCHACARIGIRAWFILDNEGRPVYKGESGMQPVCPVEGGIGPERGIVELREKP